MLVVREAIGRGRLGERATRRVLTRKRVRDQGAELEFS
jgi:hypothetical protein